MSLTSDLSRIAKFKHPGSKRLMLEAQEMMNNSDFHYYSAQPMEDNLFEWHFTFRGPQDTEFEGGVYHGRLSFPNDYPMKPPSVYLLTPNGRFETNTKICLSISGHHPETWQPSWSIRTALVALMSFMPTETNRAIGSLDFSVKERRDLARRSRSWCCEICGPIENLLKNPIKNDVRLIDGREQTNDISRDTNQQIPRDSVENHQFNARQAQDVGSTVDSLKSTSQPKHGMPDNHSNFDDNLTHKQTDTPNLSHDNDDRTYNLHHEPAQQNYSQNSDDQHKIRRDNHEVESTSSIDGAISEQQPQPQQRRRSDVDELAQSKRNFILKSTFVLLLILLLRRIFILALVA